MPSDKDKMIAKVLRARQKPLRRCLTYHDCFYCGQPIFLGETSRAALAGIHKA